MINAANSGPNRPAAPPAFTPSALTSSNFAGLPAAIAEQPIARMIWRRRRLVGKAVAAVVAVALGYCVVAPRSYTSTAELYIDSDGPRVVADGPTNADRSDNYLATQCQIIDSTSIASLALAQPGIKDLRYFHGVSDPVQYLRKNLDVEVGKKVDLIDVSLETHSRDESAKIVNAVVSAFTAYQNDLQHDTSSQVLDILDKQKAKDETELAARQIELADMREKYGGSAFDDDKQNPLLQQEAALSDALSNAKVQTVNALATFEEAVAMLGNDPAKLHEAELPDPKAIGMDDANQQTESIRTEIFRLQESLKDMQREYLPNHPAVQQAQARLDQLTISYARGAHAQWIAAQERQDELTDSFSKAHQLVLEQMNHTSDFARLDAEVDHITKDLEVIDGREKEVSVNQDAGALGISVIEPAVPPDSATGPQKTRILFGALVLGLLSGAGAAVGQEFLTLRKWNGRPLVIELDLPVLGEMPAMDRIPSSTMRALQAHAEPNGPISEASRVISCALSEVGLNELNRTLLVTSSNPLEGRTTIAVNIAISMAQTGLRVLLIDGNTDAPRLHRIFGVENEQGLHEVLSGRLAPTDAVLNTTVENLDLLLCGNREDQGADPLNNETLSDVLGQLAEEYDRVIVDSPAITGRGKATLLAANCDATVLVLPTRPKAVAAAEQSVRALRGAGANMLGVIMNTVSTSPTITQIMTPADQTRRTMTGESSRLRKQLPLEV